MLCIVPAATGSSLHSMTLPCTAAGYTPTTFICFLQVIAKHRLCKFEWKLCLSTEELFRWGGEKDDSISSHQICAWVIQEQLYTQQAHRADNRDGSCSSSSVWGSHLPPEFRNRFPLRTTGYLSASLLSGQISPSAANTTLWFVSWNFFSSSSGPPAKITS